MSKPDVTPAFMLAHCSGDDTEDAHQKCLSILLRLRADFDRLEGKMLAFKKLAISSSPNDLKLFWSSLANGDESSAAAHQDRPLTSWQATVLVTAALIASGQHPARSVRVAAFEAWHAFANWSDLRPLFPQCLPLLASHILDSMRCNRSPTTPDDSWLGSGSHDSRSSSSTTVDDGEKAWYDSHAVSFGLGPAGSLRRAAAHALHRISNSHAKSVREFVFPRILSCLTDPNCDVQEAGVLAVGVVSEILQLGNAEDQQLKEMLLGRVHGQHGLFRGNAHYALARVIQHCGGDAKFLDQVLSAFLAGVRDNSSYAQKAAFNSIEQLMANFRLPVWDSHVDAIVAACADACRVCAQGNYDALCDAIGVLLQSGAQLSPDHMHALLFPLLEKLGGELENRQTAAIFRVFALFARTGEDSCAAVVRKAADTCMQVIHSSLRWSHSVGTLEMQPVANKGLAITVEGIDGEQLLSVELAPGDTVSSLRATVSRALSGKYCNLVAGDLILKDTMTISSLVAIAGPVVKAVVVANSPAFAMCWYFLESVIDSFGRRVADEELLPLADIAEILPECLSEHFPPDLSWGAFGVLCSLAKYDLMDAVDMHVPKLIALAADAMRDSSEEVALPSAWAAAVYAVHHCVTRPPGEAAAGVNAVARNLADGIRAPDVSDVTKTDFALMLGLVGSEIGLVLELLPEFLPAWLSSMMLAVNHDEDDVLSAFDGLEYWASSSPAVLVSNLPALADLFEQPWGGEVEQQIRRIILSCESSPQFPAAFRHLPQNIRLAWDARARGE